MVGVNKARTRFEIEAEIASLQERLAAITKYGDDVHPVGTIVAGTIVAGVDVLHFAYLKITESQWASTVHSYFSNWEEMMIEIQDTLKRHSGVNGESPARLSSLRIIGQNVGIGELIRQGQTANRMRGFK